METKNQPTPVAVAQPLDQPRADVLVRRLAASAALRQRRYELLPVNGPGAPTSRPQGRRPGPATSQAGLADLISSIATYGLLGPILVEEQQVDGGAPLRVIVAGERRVLSIRRGATAAPDNPHFAQIPAIVCPGPLTEEERRSWQLIENLAREDLQPGELGAALLFERCAVLGAELERAGASLPAEVYAEPDPVARYQQLQRLREQHPGASASWQVVLRRLGLQLSTRKARAVAAAVTGLPREVSEEMDQHKVALYTRLQLLQVGARQQEVVNDLWEAVKQRGRTDLLAAAVRARRAGITDPADAAEAAEISKSAANTARSEALRRAVTEPPLAPAPTEEPVLSPGPAGHVAPQLGGASPAPGSADTTDAVPTPDGYPAPPVVTSALTALRQTVTYLANGGDLHRFDVGSLRLLVTQLLCHLEDRDRGTVPHRKERTAA